jgi:1-aminocyclopropane-1-carboxylate deaminase
MWNLLEQHPPSPLQELADPRWQAAGVRLWVKRDDLLAPEPGDPFCGNKWRKLKYNLLAARAEGAQSLLSFGGAFSNHLAALASAGRQLGFRTIGVVRGEPVDNPTLSRAKANGMELVFVSRSRFRALSADTRYWVARYPDARYLPEGGSNALALPGCAELAQEVHSQMEGRPYTLALACGTGGTLAGVAAGISRMPEPRPQLLGISALKGDFLAAEIAALMDSAPNYGPYWPHWQVLADFHHGGYAKTSPALEAFIDEMEAAHGLVLEPIYTGKLFFALFQWLAAGRFAPGSSVVAIHTGGLQGKASKKS